MQLHSGSLAKSQDCKLLAVPVLVDTLVLSVGGNREEGHPVSLQTLQSPAWSSGEGSRECHSVGSEVPGGLVTLCGRGQCDTREHLEM